MLLKHRITSLPQLKEQVQVTPEEEDAWLNDVAPPSQPQSSTVSKPEELLSQSEIKQSSSLSDDEYIGVGHPLWPIVLRISQQIWQEIYQKPDITSVSEPLLIEFV